MQRTIMDRQHLHCKAGILSNAGLVAAQHVQLGGYIAQMPSVLQGRHVNQGWQGHAHTMQHMSMDKRRLYRKEGASFKDGSVMRVRMLHGTLSID